MPKQLNRKTVTNYQDRPVRVLQFGKGNFLRGFFDWMVEIMNEKSGFNGAVLIVQVNSRQDDDRFIKQDGLYHVLINGIRNGRTVREIKLVTAVKAVVNPFSDYGEFLSAAENPHLEVIVSNTTEAGIDFDKSDRSANIPANTFPGKLTALLYRRFAFFHGDPSKAPLLLPCELIERNGEALRDAIYQYIEHWNLPIAFRRWINDHAGFCNTLVDRIVPGYPKEGIEDLWRETGYRDELAVSAEPFHLLVIQPVSTNGSLASRIRNVLPLEQAGINVRYTDDLAPYREQKVRILNGAHTIMVPVAWLRGIRTVKEAIDDGFTGTFVREAIKEEIIPTLNLPHPELKQFATDVIERFENPFIRHELSAIALNSIAKFQVRVLPTILDYYRLTHKLPERLVYAFAALIRFYRGEWQSEAIPLKDTPEVLDFFKSVWKTGDSAEIAQRVLSNEKLWKTDLTKVGGLTSGIARHLSEFGD